MYMYIYKNLFTLIYTQAEQWQKKMLFFKLAESSIFTSYMLYMFTYT
jgi:hypothetical protein